MSTRLSFAVATAREAPRAVVHNPNGDAEILVICAGFEHPVAQGDFADPDPFQAKVRMGHAEFARLAECSIGEQRRRQHKECRIDFRHSGHTIPST
jgi:hypothetical protein